MSYVVKIIVLFMDNIIVFSTSLKKNIKSFCTFSKSYPGHIVGNEIILFISLKRKPVRKD